MDSEIYLHPIEQPDFSHDGKLDNRRLGNFINCFTILNGFPEIKNAELAILGIKESRNSVNNIGTEEAPAAVRKFLYSLFSFTHRLKIIDIGNIEAGNTIDDTYYAARNVIAELLENKIIPIIIGGSQDLTYANYLAYQKQGKIVNLTTIDSSFDLGNAEEIFNSQSHISKIILHQPNFLFNLTNIGYQSYFVDYEAINLMKKLYFDVYRLGIVHADMEKTEPLIRNSDIVSFDLSAIRQSDAPGNLNASPNGFYGEEACQIARYAGISDKVSSIGFYEFNPLVDKNNQTAYLLSQMIWYFIEGFYNRKGDAPHKDKSDYLKFIVPIDQNIDEIVFYKSQKSSRWWMEIPLTSNEFEKYKRHFMVPCSYQDYEDATAGEVPDRWWQVYQKLM
ncbi:MAG: hypothetical protein AUJ98_10760 [Bacteroidetes bacterium CG2_30_33_31]|nr:MAG: hypothetical protein AUJ98_10760 [Bacteroidetes bacterium CG2_30_33_31]